jgi:hypothetical protein
MVTQLTIAEQLVDIYFKEEWWHKTRMSYADALKYHQTRLDSGSIYAYEENGEVLGYYERYFIFDTCYLHNVWVRRDERGGRVFRLLKKRFFSTLSREIRHITGEKQKLGGKTVERTIYGKH